MPQITTLEIQADYGKFVLEPLERGYGQTIGNSLRRVLLSSIQGAAIAAIRVDKVLHEFSPIPGVKEDTTEIILNLKEVAIKGDPKSVGSEAVLKIDVKGPGKVTGADIVCPEGIRIVNPEVYIATISDADAVLSLELFVAWGAGYVLPQNQDRYRGVIGLLPTGAQYTPVKKVNYTVEATRVGMRTDYERLVVDVFTNGAIAPNDAVSQSAGILLGYFRMFQEIGETIDLGTLSEEDYDIDLSAVPDLRIEELEFSQRTFNCLRRAGVLNLRQLAVTTETDLTAIRGFGKKSLIEVRDKLQEYGLEMKAPKGGVRVLDSLDSLEDDEEDENF